MVTRKKSLSRYVTLLRVAFGVIWLIDAFLKWLPGFRDGFLMQIQAAAQGQPAWLHWWFSFWVQRIGDRPFVLAIMVAVIESLIAIAVLVGFARRVTYVSAAIFSLLIWAVGEGFGGPYLNGSTDIGTGIIYALVFFALYVLEKAIPESWTVDKYIIKKLSWWRVIANP